MNPQHAYALMAFIDANIAAEHSSAVRTVLEKISPELQKQPTIKARTGLYYATVGDHRKARSIYRDLLDTPATVPSIMTCELALVLGEVEEAIDLMELLVDRQSWRQFLMRGQFRRNDAVNNHPRYLALLKRIGLDDESVAALHRKMSFDQVFERPNKIV